MSRTFRRKNSKHQLRNYMENIDSIYVIGGVIYAKRDWRFELCEVTKLNRIDMSDPKAYVACERARFHSDCRRINSRDKPNKFGRKYLERSYRTFIKKAIHNAIKTDLENYPVIPRRYLCSGYFD